MNKVILEGHLVRDVEMRTVAGESGTTVGRFSLAVNRRRANADGTRSADFLNCVSFNKIAENISQYFHKGSGILIEGHIQTGSYVNRDGQRIYTTDIIVDNWEFPASSRNAEASAPDAGAAPAVPMPEPAAASAPVDDYSVDEEIPFN